MTIGDSAETAKGYSELLGALAATHPRLSQALRKAQENRTSNLRFYLRGARLDGLEELHAYLTEVEQALAAAESGRKIAFLIQRAQADFDVALEATLSGYVSLAHDAMRDVMEIEFLLRDFAAEPANLDAWLTANSKTLATASEPIVRSGVPAGSPCREVLDLDAGRARHRA